MAAIDMAKLLCRHLENLLSCKQWTKDTFRQAYMVLALSQNHTMTKQEQNAKIAEEMRQHVASWQASKKTSGEYCADHRTNIASFAKNYKLTIGGRRVTLERLFFENATEARRGFKILFAHNNLSVAKDWANHVMSHVIAMKRGSFSFRELLNHGFDQDRILKRTSAIILKLGTPLIIDRKGTLFYNPPRQEFAVGMQYLMGLEAIISLLRGDFTCAALQICRNLPDGTDLTNEHCRSAPWERAKQMPRCIIGQLWIMWGFVKKEVVLAVD